MAPVDRKARIDVLDILRGIAILGIFFMNDPYMGQNVTLLDHDIRLIGWSGADQITWAVIAIAWEGTQRGLLELLFGAGMMVLTARAMAPDGPVAVADLFYRRNMWLLAFGLFDVFILGWPGDILHIYALAALFLFPFRTLAPKWLLLIGLSWTLASAVMGAGDYRERQQLIEKVERVEAKQRAKLPLNTADKAIMAEWGKKLDAFRLDAETAERAAAERKMRSPGVSIGDYASYLHAQWYGLQSEWFTVFLAIEAFCAMLIGVALWKWRIIQGGRSAGFYAVLMLAGYGFGMGVRAVGVWEIFQFAPVPKTIWVTEEAGRLAVTIGHLAAVNLAIKLAVGARILAPLKAAGRTAFSLYLMQQIIGIWIVFAPFGLGLWGKYSWSGLAVIAAIVVAGQLVLANIWVRYFAAGPFEWAWRSLSYAKRQPFRVPQRRGPPAYPTLKGDPVGN